MIFRKTMTKDERPIFSFGNAFRQTSLVMKKEKSDLNFDVTCMGKNSSNDLKNNNEKEEHHKSEISYTTFMKKYTDRLKKERKRQNKKQQNQTRRLSLALGTTVPNDNKSTQILVLQRLNQNKDKTITNNQAYNEVYRGGRNAEMEKKFYRQGGSESEKVNRDKISKIIHEIKSSKKRNPILNEFNEGDSVQQVKQMLNTINFPKIKRQEKEKKKKKAEDNHYHSIEPWGEERKGGQFSIQEYNIY